jgi:hypothetical protein
MKPKMADERDFIRLGKVIEPGARKSFPHRILDWFRRNLGTTIALMAAAFAGWQGCETRQARMDANEEKNVEAQRRATEAKVQEDRRKQDQEKHDAELRAEIDRAAKSQDIARLAANAANRSASSAGDLAHIAKDSLAIAKTQSEAMSRTAKASEENVNAIIRNFEFENRPQVGFKDILFTVQDDGYIAFQITYDNKGKSAADVHDHTCALYVDKTLVSKPMPRNRVFSLLHGGLITKCEGNIQPATVQAIKSGDSSLTVEISLRYSGLYHGDRTEGLCLKYNPKTPGHTANVCQ